MSENLREYKCPNCGTILVWNTQAQSLKCPYCGSEFDAATIDQYEEDVQSSQDNEIEWDVHDGDQFSASETEHMHEYYCKSCGGTIITDETTAATSCPYCGNPVVLKNQFAGMLRPDYVIPFKLDKVEALKKYKKHVSGKPLVPAVFKRKEHFEEIKGVYVPFWLYDADVDARASFMGTKTRTWSDHDYNYTETRYYSVYRHGDFNFENVPANASTKVDSVLMESIEPFDMSQAVDFKTAYLAGFLADKYNIGYEECSETANDRIRNSTTSQIQSSITMYDSIVPRGLNIQLNNEQVKYCLLPVWLLTTEYNGEYYYFAMNGQTGKFVGDLPTDKGAYMKYFIIIALVATAIILGFQFLMNWFI